MATLKLKVKNGFFTEHNGFYIDSFESTHVSANGWECNINEDGSIECIATRTYSSGVYSIRYFINTNGYAKLTLKTPYETKVLRKGFVVRKGQTFSNGTLGLTGGNINDRYAYWRDESFDT